MGEQPVSRTLWHAVSPFRHSHHVGTSLAVSESSCSPMSVSWLAAGTSGGRSGVAGAGVTHLHIYGW
jgi:hypothetical protein